MTDSPSPGFVHLHAHSSYSLLEGLLPPSRLAHLAKIAGIPAAALTDHLNLTGVVEFSQACKEAGIKALLGLEIHLALPAQAGAASVRGMSGPLVLLAVDMQGWANLCRLTASLLDHPDNTAETPASLDLLHARSQGLICLTGGRASILSQLMKTGRLEAAHQFTLLLKQVFGDRLYLEVGPEPGLRPIVNKLAREVNLPLVAAWNVYYERPQDEVLQQTVTGIRKNLPIASLKEEDSERGAYFPGEDEMRAAFRDLPEALHNTLEVTERCNFELPFGIPRFPRVALPPGATPAQVLRQKSEQGARKIYGGLTPALQERLDRELEIIHTLQFEPVFLIMQEIIEFARSAGVPVSSRGSAASSLVAHCLGITYPDPIGLNLYFERFLNPARSTPPDIDTDLCSRRRDLVIQHVFEQYGQDHVAMVGTINRFRVRSALSDVAKAHGFSPDEVRLLASKLPYRFYFPRASEEEESSAESPYKELEREFPSPRHQQVFRQARALLGIPRHLSVHAGGIVITPGPLTDLIPAQRSTKGVIITQFDHTMLEPLGIIKLDLLGIRGLTVLGDVAETIHSWRQSEYTSALEVLDDIPRDDPETAMRILNGQTIGCFQIESPGMRATLKEIHARSIEDLIVALALYRPGPLTGGLKDAFVRRHTGQEPISQIHPALAPLLEDTYGVILYQEQVLRIAHELAGLTLAESDLLRRAMSHFDPGKQMQTLKEKFIRGAAQKSGVEAATAEKIWELMAAFAGYGFPKAHAASYALIAWQSAWCKTHFPAEFMAAVLANWGGYYSQRVYLMEARRMGLKVKPPHINHSHSEFSVAYPQGEPVLYMGLDQVRNLTHRTQQKLVQKRPFHSFEDFIERAQPRKEELNNLIGCGALEGLGTIPDLLKRTGRTPSRPGQMSLFAMEQVTGDEPDWDDAQKAAAQEEILGISVDRHRLEFYTDKIAASSALSTLEASARIGKRVRVAGVRQSSHRSFTAKGGMVLFLSLEDLDGMLEVVVFSDVYRRYRPLLSGSQPLLIEGVVEFESERGEPILRAEKVFNLELV